MSEVNALTNAGAGFYRMTPIEVATGWLTGESSDAAPTAGMPAPRGPAPGVLGPGVLGPGVLGPGVLGSPAPLEALESLLAPALARPPCVVAFSGGRDSSALLAVATSLAARRGLAKPIAGTLDYAGEQDADEREWQELVVRRLGVADWEKVTVGDGADLLGPVATDGLRRHGLLWPPAHHTILPLLRLASGGSLVTGDGGDEVFGGHRVTPLVRLLHGRLPRSRGEVAEGGLALAPRLSAIVPTFVRCGPRWRGAGCARAREEIFAAAAAADKAAEPIGWRTSLRRLPLMRAWALGFHNQDILAAEVGTRIVRPLQDAPFLEALSRCSPPWGFAGRDEVMRSLFGHLLPEASLRRPTKATFNRVVFGQHSRAFARAWTGRGVPAELVDPDVLRRFWEAPVPHALSFALLQAAWLFEATPPTQAAAHRLAVSTTQAVR